MLIDWFTVAAQTLNFLILVWLLKRYLYQPILNAIDAREQRIAAELADADAQRAEAEKARQEFEQKNAELEKNRASLLSQATEEAEKERRRLLEEARQKADALAKKRQETLQQDAKNLSVTLTRRAQDEVFAITRKLLSELASASLEEQIGNAFTRRLGDLDGEAKKKMTAALACSKEPALLRSAFELPAAQRAAIEKAVKAAFSAAVEPSGEPSFELSFEVAPGLIGGIELSASGQKIAFSLEESLKSLEKGIEDVLNEGRSAA